LACHADRIWMLLAGGSFLHQSPMNLPIASNPVVPSAEELVTNFEEAVHLETVSVRYRVPSERVRTFKEYFIRRLKGEVQMRTFWALQDVTLDIYRGEVFGLVGVNGAGRAPYSRWLRVFCAQPKVGDRKRQSGSIVGIGRRFSSGIDWRRKYLP